MREKTLNKPVGPADQRAFLSPPKGGSFSHDLGEHTTHHAGCVSHSFWLDTTNVYVAWRGVTVLPGGNVLESSGAYIHTIESDNGY